RGAGERVDHARDQDGQHQRDGDTAKGDATGDRGLHPLVARQPEQQLVHRGMLPEHSTYPNRDCLGYNRHMFDTIGRTFSLIMQSRAGLMLERRLILLAVMAAVTLLVDTGAIAGLAAGTGAIDRLETAVSGAETQATALDYALGGLLL